ncbi:Sodium channel protein type 5 subunit alpha [Durusdinium trenchii]|uniref:Sodium channel protein type 5 subunit alpha n=1 Tax=Durusdinium trenchii TaxID=1381693 RepID=A0ABP0K7F3_9DINO
MGYFADLFNLFDTLLILACCVDLYILRTVLGEQTPLRVLRMFKLARVARLVRLMQLFRGENGLRLLVSACRSFLPSLGWAMALMGGVTMGLLLQDFIRDEAQDLHLRQWMWLRYGTAYRATYTMYEITFAGPTGISEWDLLKDLTDSLKDVKWSCWVVVFFPVIRVITAIFLSQTLEAANNDVDLMMIQERIRKKSIFVEQLEGIFQAIDESGDGLLSEDEMILAFETAARAFGDVGVHAAMLPLVYSLSKDLPGMWSDKLLDREAYLESLEVNLPESEALFRLLQNSALAIPIPSPASPKHLALQWMPDLVVFVHVQSEPQPHGPKKDSVIDFVAQTVLLSDRDGQITYDDFIEGILRCKGPARAMDQIVLQAEVKALGDSLQSLSQASSGAGVAGLVDQAWGQWQVKNHPGNCVGGFGPGRSSLDTPSLIGLFVKHGHPQHPGEKLWTQM